MIASVLLDCFLCCEALVESHFRSFSTKRSHVSDTSTESMDPNVQASHRIQELAEEASRFFNENFAVTTETAKRMLKPSEVNTAIIWMKGLG